MILPDWVGYLILLACFGGAALAIAWKHARDVLASILASVRSSQDEPDDEDPPDWAFPDANPCLTYDGAEEGL